MADREQPVPLFLKFFTLITNIAKTPSSLPDSIEDYYTPQNLLIT